MNNARGAVVERGLEGDGARERSSGFADRVGVAVVLAQPQERCVKIGEIGRYRHIVHERLQMGIIPLAIPMFGLDLENANPHQKGDKERAPGIGMPVDDNHCLVAHEFQPRHGRTEKICCFDSCPQMRLIDVDDASHADVVIRP